MSDPCATIPDMNLDLERLIAFHDTPGDTYPDLLAATAYRLTTRPGDIDRCANAIHQLVTEIAGHRTGQHA